MKWRGDLSFEKSPLNEVDNIILTRISYMPLDKIELEDKSKWEIEFRMNSFMFNSVTYKMEGMELE